MIPTLDLRPSPAPSDPLVVLVAAVIVFAAAIAIIGGTHDARTRTVRLLFLYIAYGLCEVVVKRLAHFVWFIYPIRLALFAIVLISWTQWRNGQRRSLNGTPLFGVLAAYLALAAIQIFNPYQANPIVGAMGWLTDFGFVFLYFVGFDVLGDVVSMERFLKFTAVLGVISALACFAELWYGPEELLRAYPAYVYLVFFTTSGGVVYRPSTLSPYLEVFAIVAMIGLLTARQGRLWLLALGIAICAVSSVLHAVRIAWMTGFVMLAVMSLLNRGRRVVSIGLVAASIALAVNVAMSATNGEASRSLMSATTPVATFQQTRLWGLVALPRMMLDYPFGVGVGEASPAVRFLGDATDLKTFGAHNYLTELTGQMSVVGPLLLLAFSVAVVFRVQKSLKRTSTDQWRAQVTTSLAIVGALTLSFFGGGSLGAYPTTDYFWLMAGAAMSMTTVRDRRSAPARAPERPLLTRVALPTQ